ncbi:prorelaxin H1 [Lampris incognitus]|uniref:prorelaxin H1 n=1 Tax=Lampris incognitus TaxID=2546036 RepID=UPI0024B56C07|nr:prorelaxin H1 [Lampris incognitus]
MLWGGTLAVMVMCMGHMCGCAEADAAGALLVPRDYGVKLCGREFIRAVIFTCGGSRWRRSVEEHLAPPQRRSYMAEGNQHIWQTDAEVLPADATDAHSTLRISPSSYSLADLLALLGAPEDPKRPVSNTESLRDIPESTALGEQQRNPGADWPERNKRKRNFSLGVAGMCCNQGCTKQDIGRLC